ncbi:MAG: RICIN domain-containing protein [Fibrobacterales bacterium]
MTLFKQLQLTLITGLMLGTTAFGGYQLSELPTPDIRNPKYSHALENGVVYWGGEPSEEVSWSDIFKSTQNEYTNISNTPDTWEHYKAIDGETYVYQQDRTVFYFNGTEDITILTDIGFSMGPMDLDNGQFVFTSYDGDDSEIMLYDGSNLIQITDNDRDDTSPKISNGEIVWVSYDYPTPGSFIHHYSNGVTTTISDIGTNDKPDIENGTIVWQGPGIEDETDIFRYKDGITKNLSVSGYHDQEPQISEGQVAWKSRYYHFTAEKVNIEHFEIMFYDGQTTTSITSQDLNYDDFDLNNGEIAISAYSKEDYIGSIHHWDGIALHTISNNDDGTSRRSPMVENGLIVWDEWSSENGSRIMTARKTDFNPEATYALISRSSGRALEVDTQSAQWNGGYIQIWDYYGGDNQLWNIIPTEAGYKLINNRSGKALDVAGLATYNGGTIHQWDYVGGQNQQWNFTHQGDGSYSIVNLLSGKAVDVKDNGTWNGNAIQQWDFHGNDNQKWDIIIVE